MWKWLSAECRKLLVSFKGAVVIQVLLITKREWILDFFHNQII